MGNGPLADVTGSAGVTGKHNYFRYIKIKKDVKSL